jgi:hypothetical protein
LHFARSEKKKLRIDFILSLGAIPPVFSRKEVLDGSVTATNRQRACILDAATHRVPSFTTFTIFFLGFLKRRQRKRPFAKGEAEKGKTERKIKAE